MCKRGQTGSDRYFRLSSGTRCAVNLRSVLSSPPLFWQGVVIGFSIAAPVGPIGVLCIRRSLTDGPRIGFAAGLGAALADAFYGGVAALGLTSISSFLVDQQFWLGLIGGAFLCCLGLRTMRSPVAEKSAQNESKGFALTCVSTLGLTLTNPATILSFVAIFAGFGLGKAKGAGSAIAMVSGVFLGSLVWWTMLSGGVGWLRQRLEPGWLVWVNRLSGLLLLAFGVLILLRLHR